MTVIRAGLALRRHQQAKGAYPKTLAEAGLTERIDPFSGKPLCYRLTETGFLIYSVGENQQDDGGQAVDKQDHPLDIAWEFKMP